ncbi:MAG: tryptophan--tRNA ligase [Hydrotalea sp.]|nr:tryptophan--tRNA ligase [Hydrotalea sp.]
MAEKTKRVLSGIQPTGAIHLGNYLGAVKNWVALQRDMACLFCIVDMHAITVWQEPTELKKATLSLAATLLACGIDPDKHILFHQSGNPDHSELAWIFNCVARLGWLNRMTQFKDKAGKDREKASTGLYVYPNLMAADILVYHATHVPVGEDQKQHLELARDIADKFNHDFNAPDFFTLPAPLILPVAARVMSLRDGTKKMSKSDPSDQSRINLLDGNDAIADKIKRAKTDSGVMPDKWDDLEKTRPDVANLIGIMAGLTDATPEKIVADYAGKDFSSFKKSLSEAMVATLSPIREKIIDFEKNQDHLQQILINGAARAHDISHPILKKTKELVGFIG